MNTNVKACMSAVVIAICLVSCHENKPAAATVATDSAMAIADTTAVVPAKKTAPAAAAVSAYAQAVLDHKTDPEATNPNNAACMDSIDDPNPATRKYYFEVFRLLSAHADEGIAGVAGENATRYLEQYPEEAIAGFKRLTKEEQKFFTSVIGLNLWKEEVNAAAVDKQTLDPYFQRIRGNCKNCSTEAATLSQIRAGIRAYLVKIS